MIYDPLGAYLDDLDKLKAIDVEHLHRGMEK